MQHAITGWDQFEQLERVIRQVALLVAGNRDSGHVHYFAAPNPGSRCSYSRAAVVFRSTPMPSTSTSIVSPGCIAPTPSGVPVMMTSPG